MNPHVASLLKRAATFGVSDIANAVLADPRFDTWSASSHSYQHHYGTGMLARHTSEVVDLCLANRGLLFDLGGYSMPTPNEVYLAALFHDAGKMDDYRHIERPFSPLPDPWEAAPHKRLVHHISRSAIIWSRAVDRFPAYRHIEDNVLHAILAHHGTREWGSPVAPKSRLAWLLHLCDCLSARMNDADTLDVVKHYGA